MNLIEHYNNLYNAAINSIESDTYDTDSLIDSLSDKRLGVTLIIRPSQTVKNNIQTFLKALYKNDSSQYYYPNSDIHITVMSIISCYNGFNLNKISISDYVSLVKKSLQNVETFHILFKGITASKSGIMIQGFPKNETLNNLRDQLRINFKNSPLEQSLDQRYAIQTAHATVVRFRNELKNKKDFLKTIQEFKNYDFGSFEVKELNLVFNDWYLREKQTKILETFYI
ncbi:MAG: mutarotase [Flavobacteriaceae bacterium]|nr:mutarotase [Flavobacteriaceae bacterium]